MTQFSDFHTGWSIECIPEGKQSFIFSFSSSEVALWVFVASIIGGVVAAAVLGAQKGSIANNNIDANYAKHDFSKFDN